MEKLNVDILSPYGKYLTTKIDKINVYSEDFNLGISPGHSPLISSLVISKMILENDGEEKIYAIGGGVIVIKNGSVKLLLDSIESKDEIDFERATASKKRAEERLANSDGIDVSRAEASLKRALNRIEIFNL